MPDWPSAIDLIRNRRQEDELAPLTATYELTMACNLRCSHCYLEHRPARDELTTRQWFGFIDQAADLGAFFGGFTGGEILCRPDFLEIAGYAFRRGIFFHLQTNGTLIDREMARRIHDLQPTKVEVSIYGASAGVHDAITGVPGSFVKSLKAVDLLHELGIRLFIKTTVMSGNWRDVPALRRLADEHGVWFMPDPVLVPGVFGSASPLNQRMNDDEYRRYMIAEGWDREPGKEFAELVEESSRPDRRVLCTAAKKRFTIAVDGEVIPCVMWRQSCGNLLNQSLESIWYGETMTGMRKLKFEDLQSCASCEHYLNCVRCAGLAYMETGDYRGCPSECRRMSSLLAELRG